MASKVFRNGTALFKVLEDAPFDLVASFFSQPDEHFAVVRDPLAVVMSLPDEDPTKRSELLGLFAPLAQDNTKSIELECQRVLEVSEKSGPASLLTIARQRSTENQCEMFERQVDPLCKGLWMHVNNRRVFDDAVSFNRARSWRGAESLYGKFEIDLDDAEAFVAGSVDLVALEADIKTGLKSPHPCVVTLIELPSNAAHPASIIVIARFAGQQSSVAVHGKEGARRVLGFLPQEEAVLIYTPTDGVLEVAGKRSDIRNVAVTSFAKIALKHDLSAKPLTWANYDTSRFRKSLELDAPEVAGVLITSARVIEIELRLNSWTSKLALRAGENDDIIKLSKAFLSEALRRSSSISKIVIEVTFQQGLQGQKETFNIQISDRNRSNVSSMVDIERRRVARKLLELWGIAQPFRDLSADEALALMPIMSELSDWEEPTVRGTYFIDRNVDPTYLVRAGLIKLKEVDPTVLEPDLDSGADEPSLEDRVVYTIRRDWMVERTAMTLANVVGQTSTQEIVRNLWSLGSVEIDGESVRIYFAKGLSEMRNFLEINAHLGAPGHAGTGLVLTVSETGWPSIGNKPLISCYEGQDINGPGFPVSFDQICELYRGRQTQRMPSLPPQVIPAGKMRVVLRVANKADLHIDGQYQVRGIELLHADYITKKVGVTTEELIKGTSYKSVGHLFGGRWQEVNQIYVRKLRRKTWMLVGE